jgi:hypothetical protein
MPAPGGFVKESLQAASNPRSLKKYRTAGSLNIYNPKPGFAPTPFQETINIAKAQKHLKPIATNYPRSKKAEQAKQAKQSVNQVKKNKPADQEQSLRGTRNKRDPNENETQIPKQLERSNPSELPLKQDINNPNPPAPNRNSRNPADPIMAITEVRNAAEIASATNKGEVVQAPAAERTGDPIKEAPKLEIVPFNKNSQPNSQSHIPKALVTVLKRPDAPLTEKQQNALATMITAEEGEKPSTPKEKKEAKEEANAFKNLLIENNITNIYKLQQALINNETFNNTLTQNNITLNLKVVNTIVNNNYNSPVPQGPVYPGISPESAAAASTAAAAILSSMSFSREPKKRSISEQLRQRSSNLEAINASSKEQEARKQQRKEQKNSNISKLSFIRRMFATVFRGYPLKTVRKKLSSTIKRLSNQFETQRRVEETMEEREKQKQTQSEEPVLQTIVGGSKPGNGFSIQPKVINGITKNNLSSNSTKSIKGVTKSKEAKKYSNRKIMKTHRKSMKKTTKATK